MNNKDLIAQYIDTGLRIPKEQMVQLPTWAKKTYMRKRMIAAKNRAGYILGDYELDLLEKDTLSKYLNWRLKTNFHLENYELNRLTPDHKMELAIERAEKGKHLNDEMFKALPDNIKTQFVNGRLDKNNPMSSIMLKYGGESVTNKYLKRNGKE